MPPATKKRASSAIKPKTSKGSATNKKARHQPGGIAKSEFSVPEDTKKIGSYKSHQIGVCTADAGDKLDETTWECDYRAIALGKKLPWFMEYVSSQEEGGFQLPQESHGFSRMLTNVHRAHPSLVYSWEDQPAKKGGPPVISVYKVRSYESAGVWRDSDGDSCLVLRAVYKEPGMPQEQEVHLLYESGIRDSEAAILEEDTMDLWAVTDVGTGGHLKKAGGKIQLGNPCKPPKGG